MKHNNQTENKHFVKDDNQTVNKTFRETQQPNRKQKIS